MIIKAQHIHFSKFSIWWRIVFSAALVLFALFGLLATIFKSDIEDRTKSIFIMSAGLLFFLGLACYIVSFSIKRLNFIGTRLILHPNFLQFTHFNGLKSTIFWNEIATISNESAIENGSLKSFLIKLRTFDNRAFEFEVFDLAIDGAKIYDKILKHLKLEK